MVVLRTAKGTDVNCDAVIRGQQYPVLHIYTNEITPVQAYQIFGDPEATEELTVIEEYMTPVKMEDGTYANRLDTREKVYHGFTEIFSVQKAQLYRQNENEILIWMQRPADNAD